jgi:hypothetical protein
MYNGVCSSEMRTNDVPLALLQVTRSNFESSLPAVREAISSSDYISFDCEMTGLFLDNNEHSFLDNMPARYHKVCMSVHRGCS